MIKIQKVILIRSHYPDSRLEKEAETLSKKGFQVSLLVWDRGRLKSKKQNSIPLKRMNLNVPSGHIKVIFYLPIWWLFIMFNLFIKKWDVVHAADFDTYVPALIVSKIKRKSIVYDIFDFYADMIEFPIMKKISRKIIGRIDKFLMKYADSVIIADDSRFKQIGNNANNNIKVIYNSPVDRYSKTPLKKDDDFVVFFGGWISQDKAIDKVILAVKNLMNVKLIIMGFCDPWNYKNELERISQNAENIELHLNAVPHKTIIEYTSKADLLFAFYDPKIPNNRYASPNKLFEAMMCEKPIIVNENTAMASIVMDEKCGIVIPYGNVELIKDSILALKNNADLLQDLGENGRSAYETKYNWSLMESKLLHIYNNL